MNEIFKVIPEWEKRSIVNKEKYKCYDYTN